MTKPCLNLKCCKMAKKKKKSSEKKEPKKDVFYVGVQDPVEIRRNVLECSKDMVQFMQRYENLKNIRNDKEEAIHHLKEDVRELKSLVNKLRKVLPKSKLRIKSHEEKKEEKPKPKKKKGKKKKAKKETKKEAPKEETTPPPKPKTEIERLESELADIEEKLGKLS